MLETHQSAKEKEPIDPVRAYKLSLEDSADGKQKMSPLFADRALAEQFRNPWAPDRRVYGALPYLKFKSLFKIFSAAKPEKQA